MAGWSFGHESNLDDFASCRHVEMVILTIQGGRCDDQVTECIVMDSISPSEIDTRQNEPFFQRLFKARQWRWAVAVRWQMGQLALVLTAPILVLTLGTANPDTNPWISFLAVCLTMIDVAWIDRSYKASLKAAARASELFDCELLSLHWNTLVAGKQPTPEETDRAVRGWDELRSKDATINWYAADVGRAPLGLARVICQRTNLTYDNGLRILYRTLLDTATLVIAAAVIGTGIAGSTKFADFVLAGWVPVAPFVIWAVRERFRQSDAVTANDSAIAEAERLISSVINQHCTDAECQAQSRALQDAIFLRRSTIVLLFPGIYGLRRKQSENDMHAGAKFWVEKAGL